VTTVLGSSSGPFQPSGIPFNTGAIACGYLAGMLVITTLLARTPLAVPLTGRRRVPGRRRRLPGRGQRDASEVPPEASLARCPADEEAPASPAQTAAA
jgi:hypothetical protein